MTTPCDTRKPCPCDCRRTSEPGRVNEAGLPAIAYRLGTHGQFLQRMLGRVHTDPVLRERLTVRHTDDPAIAMLDAWAVVGDVLTFYQERIANEGYLRTAVERRSVLEMARTIGYELNPGVAAGACLAFTVDDTTKAYAAVTIPPGTQVQSLPAQGKLPQTFETSAEFVAHVEWNSLRPRRSLRQILGIKSGKLYLLVPAEGGDASLSDFALVNPADDLPEGETVTAAEVGILYLDGIATQIKNGDLILLAGIDGDGKFQTFVRPAASVAIEKERNRTVVVLDATAPAIAFAPGDCTAGGSIATGIPFGAEQVKGNVLTATVSEKMMNALIDVNRWDRAELLDHVAAVHGAAGSPAAGQGVFAFRERAGFFGNNAPAWRSLPAGQRYDTYYVKHEDGSGEWVTGEPVYGQNWDGAAGWEIWKNYPDGEAYSMNGADAYLERKVDGIGREGWVVFECPAAAGAGRYAPYVVGDTREEAVTGFSLSARTTGLQLAGPDGSAITKSSSFTVRNTTAHVKSEALTLAPLPIEDDLEEERTDESGAVTATGVTRVMLDGLVLGLTTGQPVIVQGEQVDAEGVEGRELAVLKDIIHSRGYTVLYFKDALQHRYVRDSVTINANVVPATHGETVREVLGSGDGTRTNQRFVLRKPPLTYVSAATPSGAESTLTVKVDGVAWEEAASLFGQDGESRRYIVRRDDDGRVTVQFGDGRQGTRLPTGQENIVATYRSGIGFDGEAAAGSLTLLKTRPLGIRSVTNPLAADGADEPETMDAARTNAPLTVLTMDRIVSLTDYEDFARAFTGIGKAKAVVLWNGEADLVHITIADAHGGTVDAVSDTYKNLARAIDTYRNPMAQVRIDTFDLRLFHVEARVLIDAAYTAADVLGAAELSLQGAFSFAKRDFGRPVTAAEVVHVIQQVPGIVYVDLNKLYLTDDAAGPSQTRPAAVLAAQNARWPEGGTLERAQLLLINPVGIALEEIPS